MEALQPTCPQGVPRPSTQPGRTSPLHLLHSPKYHPSLSPSRKLEPRAGHALFRQLAVCWEQATLPPRAREPPCEPGSQCPLLQHSSLAPHSTQHRVAQGSIQPGSSPKTRPQERQPPQERGAKDFLQVITGLEPRGGNRCDAPSTQPAPFRDQVTSPPREADLPASTPSRQAAEGGGELPRQGQCSGPPQSRQPLRRQWNKPEDQAISGLQAECRPGQGRGLGLHHPSPQGRPGPAA